ncbi:hypothetical protein PR048_004541 [Dryococelus australis]|uniref:Uncharacterized protein n=1 Tax=Dryococelus australis TaxID=614101 RepID=A0ABQ9I5R0_9NEOP|nr:hypothetical protein PR048_004541 [Dryococelus australis]
MFPSIQSINDHAPFGCSFSDMEETKETRQDLASTIYFKCKNCNIEKKIQTESYAEEQTCMNVNTSTVSGSMAIGPTKKWERRQKMKKDEATLAREYDDVDKEYFPLVTVVADCMWGKDPTGISTIPCMEQKSNRPLHKCYKNWTGASTAMEADGIVAGFTTRVPLHGIK